MIVKVNCPIAGCGTLVQVLNLPRHLEKVHELDGELLLRLHPTSSYTLFMDVAPEPEPEKEPEKEPEIYTPENEPEE